MLVSNLYGVPSRNFLRESVLDEQEKQEALSAVLAAVEEGGERRSALYQWMLDNHDAFSEMVSRRRPNWKRLAEVFTGLGLSDGDKPLVAETVRQYWWRVRQSKSGVKLHRRKKRKSSGQERQERLEYDVVEHVSPSSHSRSSVSPVARSSPVGGPSQALSSSGDKPSSGSDDDNGLAAIEAEMNRRSGRI
jgi:hypothetical protein